MKRSKEHFFGKKNIIFLLPNIQITQLLFRKLETSPEGFSNLSDLVEMLLSISVESKNEKQLSEDAPPETQSNIQNELKQLEQIKMCKICCQGDACIVFSSCGHLCCCETCGNQVEKCPLVMF